MTTKYVGSGLDLGGTVITNAGSPSASTDVPNKAYVDNVAAGLDAKQSARAATTANITLSAPQTIDGISVIAGNRVLVKNQTTASANGIYQVNAGAWTLTADSQTGTLTSGALVSIEEGTANGAKAFVLTTVNPITVGTTSQVWSPFSAGTTYTAGNGLQLGAGSFSILLDSSPGLLSAGSGLKVDPAYSGLAKRYAANVTAGSTTATMTHGLGTADLIVQVVEVSTGNVVEPDISVNSTTIVLTFAVAPTTNQFRVIAIA